MSQFSRWLTSDLVRDGRRKDGAREMGALLMPCVLTDIGLPLVRRRERDGKRLTMRDARLLTGEPLLSPEPLRFLLVRKERSFSLQKPSARL